MKSVVSLTLIAVLSIALGLSTAVEAGATTRDVGIARDAIRALERQNESAAGVDDQLVDVAAGRLRAPAGAGQVSIDLPGRKVKTRKVGSLSVGASAGDQYRTAIQETGDGTVRVLIHIASADAPRKFDFTLDPGLSTAILPDGGIQVRDGAGSLVGTFSPPWASDARGRPVPTYFQARGSRVTQVVRPTRSTTFPVVADPFWIPIILIAGRLIFGTITRHAARQAAARGISQALIREVIKNGRRSKGNGNTSIFTQGSGKNRIRVIVDNESGNVITVTKG